MKRSLVALVLLAAALAAQPGAAEKAMTLQDCILAALKNNLNLAAEIIGPEAAASATRRAGEVFLPKLSFTLGKQRTNSASYSGLDATDQITADFADYEGTFQQFLPTGATLSTRLYSYSNSSNQGYQTINPRFGASLSFNFAQPLLRDFGFKMSRRQIIIAGNNQEVSEQRLRQALVDTVYNVEEAYWNLVYSRENLKVQQESLKLARDLLAKNTRELEVGTIPPIDLLSARAEVASREADILQAEAQVKNDQDTLRTLLNLPRDKGAPGTVILPTETPQAEPVPLNFEEARTRALAHRPDLASSRVDLRTKGLNLSYARNQTLPNLSLQATYWSPGVAGTQILYQDDNPLTGIIVGTVPGGRNLAFKDAFKFKYENWFVGLTFELPLESLVSRAQVTQARLESEQAALRLRNLEEQAVLEVEIAVRAVETDYKRAQAYGVARELAAEKLAAEEKKLMAGLSTNYTVLQQQRDLALARTNEIKARVDFSLSRARLEKAMGTTLESMNIKFAEMPGR
jgi:outer membrane protein TolC